jgi:membrane fusion protein
MRTASRQQNRQQNPHQDIVAEPKPRLPANEPLFRTEVLAERQTKWLGTVLLAPTVSHGLFAVFATLAMAAILGLVFFASYTRKAHVNGWLVPQLGMVRVFAPASGVVTQVYTQEGAEVRAGTPLLVLSTEIRSEALGATREEIVRRLVHRRDSMTAQLELQSRMFEQQKAGMSNRLATLQIERMHLGKEMEFQQARLKLLEEDTIRQRTLRQRDIVTAQRLQLAETSQLEVAAELQKLERDRASTERELLALEGDLQELPLKNLTQLAEIERSIASLEQELAEAEARREIVITAPQDGTVTAIQVETGGGANSATPLLNIVPSGSKLEAQLFSPSRGIGFVRAGQRVLLRYQAYPYQKFGYYEGTVASVSRTAVNPAELAPQLAGMTSLFAPNEPVYRITVSLASQTATAYGEPVPLQPGMQLEADVVMESRRLIEWILDPLFTLTGKWEMGRLHDLWTSLVTTIRQWGQS